MTDNVLRWQTEDFHDTSELLYLIFARKQRISRIQLGQDTAQAPHIDRRAIGKTKNHFWTPVKPRLYVRVDALMTITRGTEIDDFDRATTPLF